MRFAIISPASGLQEFSTLSKTHLVLAHVQNPVYWQFYRKLAQDPSQLIILDNGAYERQLNIELAIERVHWLGRVDALVMPDAYKGNAEDNFKLAVNFLKEWRHKLPCDLMYCPQFNGTYTNFRDMCYHMMGMMDHFGIRYFGLPRIIAELGYSRSELCLALKRHRAQWDEPGEFYVHALGMCAGSVRELEELDAAQCDSIDSSAPVWRGWNGFDIDWGQQWAKNGSDCDFNARIDELSTENRQLIYSNLRKVGVQC